MKHLFSVDQSVEVLRAQGTEFPETCIVLGTGWNKVLAELTVEHSLSYQEVFGVSASVPGHDGKLVIGSLSGKRIACMVGRLHTYEGYTTEEVTRPLQALARHGLHRVILTAAVGGLRPSLRVGDFVVLSDMLTAFCPSPLTGPSFVDLSAAFDLALGQKAMSVAKALSISASEGVYCYVRGPHFETPADKRLYHQLGADVVGMSVVPEVIMARSLGVQVLGLAFVTNLAFVVHAHEDVLAAAERGSQQMVQLLHGVCTQ